MFAGDCGILSMYGRFIMSHENTPVPTISPTLAAPSVNLEIVSFTKKKRIRGGYHAPCYKSQR